MRGGLPAAGSCRLYRAGRRIAQLYHEGIFRLGRRASRGCSAEFADNRPCGGNSRYRDRCFHGACRHVRGRGGHAPADSSRFIWLRVSWHDPRYRHCDGWWRGRPNLVGIYWIFLRPDLRGVAYERGRLDCLCLCNSLSGRRLWRRDDRDRACFAQHDGSQPNIGLRFQQQYSQGHAAYDTAVLRCRRLAGLCRCHERAADELAVAAF